MKKLNQIQTTLCVGLLAFAPLALADQYAARPYSDQPEHQTLSQAIAFEKYKEISAETQARKDAGETQNASQTSKRSKQANRATANANSQTSRKAGQADAAKKP